MLPHWQCLTCTRTGNGAPPATCPSCCSERDANHGPHPRATQPATLASDLREMMNAWDRIRAAARREFPGATDEKIQEIAAGAMDHALRVPTRAR